VKTAHKAIKAVLQLDFVQESLDPIVFTELKRLFINEPSLTRRCFCKKAKRETAEDVLENEDILSHIFEFNSNPEVLYVSRTFAQGTLRANALSIGSIWRLESLRATPVLEQHLKALVPLSLLRPMQPFKIVLETKPPKIATLANTLFYAYGRMLQDGGMNGPDPYHRELTEALKNVLLNSVRATRNGRNVIVAEWATGISIQ
jgi:hypothetical protein